MAGNTERPLSPHLQVYRPQMTSVMSILHRITGFALAVGTLMVIWLLIAAAAGPEAFAAYTDFITAPLGQLLLFGWTLAFFIIWQTACGIYSGMRESCSACPGPIRPVMWSGL